MCWGDSSLHVRLENFVVVGFFKEKKKNLSYARDQTLLEMAYAIQFSGARVMVVSSSGMWDKISARAADFDNIKTVVFGATTSPGAPPSGSKIQVVVWSELLAKASSSHVPSVLDVRPQDAAAWVFTAGVTGAPKAVVLTHNMLVEAGRAAQAHFNLNSEDVIASHLSFANALQQVLEIVLPCISGAQVTYCNPVADFRTICSTVAPTFIAGLPSEWHSLVQFFTSESAGKELAQLTDSEKKQLVSLSKLEKCRWPLCVWSAISVASCLEIRSLNIPLYRVYGLAEACGLVSLEGPGKSSSNIQLGVGIPIQVREEKRKMGEFKVFVFLGIGSENWPESRSPPPRTDCLCRIRRIKARLGGRLFGNGRFWKT